MSQDQDQVLRQAVNQTRDLGSQILWQCHDCFDEFHIKLEQTNHEENNRQTSPSTVSMSLPTCDKWQQLRSTVVKLNAVLATLSAVVPVLNKVVLVINTLVGLLDSICPVSQQEQTN
jgi:hypothetical protein